MIQLTLLEQTLAAGEAGEAAALSMRILCEAAAMLGAERLIPIASAHIDGALYHGDSGTLFAEKLRAGGARVAVPTTLNVGALDLHCGARVRLPPHERDMALRLMRAYEAMGCEPSWTCAPYQAGHRPAAGTDVAWGESNAVAFCNSVLGARTNRYGDFLDICCAITGRAPDYGLHRPENRRARLVVDCTALPPALLNTDAAWPVLGTLYGQIAGNAIGALTGLAPFSTEDRLKAFGAAAASAGAVALFHLVGVTPEAPSLDAALGGVPPETEVSVDTSMLRHAYAALSTTADTTIGAVAIGSPHCSVAELFALLRLIGARRLAVPFYACTGRHAVAALEAAGGRAGLEQAGVTLVTDTCIVVTPMLAEAPGVLMTNSGKFAHYAPGNTGYAVQYGSLAECVESAIAGRLIRDVSVWS